MDFESALNTIGGGQNQSVNTFLGWLQPMVINQLPDGYHMFGWGPDDLANHKVSAKYFLSIVTSAVGNLNPANTTTQSQSTTQNQQTNQTNTTNTTNGTTNQPIPQQWIETANALSGTEMLLIGAVIVGGVYFAMKGGR